MPPGGGWPATSALQSRSGRRGGGWPGDQLPAQRKGVPGSSRAGGEGLRGSHMLDRSALHSAGPPPRLLPSAALGGGRGRGPMPTAQHRMLFPAGHASWPCSCSVDVRQTLAPPGRAHQGSEGKGGLLLGPGRAGAPRTAGGGQVAGPQGQHSVSASHGLGWSATPHSAFWFAVRVRTPGHRRDDAHRPREPEGPVPGPPSRYDAEAEVNR